MHDDVVIDPHHPDAEEAYGIARIAGPGVKDRRAQRRAGRVDAENEKCGRDRKYAVAEGLQAPGRHHRPGAGRL